MQRDNCGSQKTSPQDANFLSQHLGVGGGSSGLSPISPSRSLRQGAGESGAEIRRGRAVSASAAAPGIAPAPAAAPQRVCSPAGCLAEPLRRSERASIPVWLVGGGGAGGRELTGNSQTAGVGELGSLGWGSRRHRVEGPGNRLRWAIEAKGTPVSPSLFPSQLL